MITSGSSPVGTPFDQFAGSFHLPLPEALVKMLETALLTTIVVVPVQPEYISVLLGVKVSVTVFVPTFVKSADVIASVPSTTPPLTVLVTCHPVNSISPAAVPLVTSANTGMVEIVVGVIATL